MTLFDSLSTDTDHVTSPAMLEHQLFEHITHYVSQYSFVKLEAALTQMVYNQFRQQYLQADDIEKLLIEKQIEQYTPSRQQLKAYLGGAPIGYHYANTLANFFQVTYILINHDPIVDLTQH